jgi:hypothetical protein
MRFFSTRRIGITDCLNISHTTERFGCKKPKQAFSRAVSISKSSHSLTNNALVSDAIGVMSPFHSISTVATPNAQACANPCR